MTSFKKIAVYKCETCGEIIEDVDDITSHNCKNKISFIDINNMIKIYNKRYENGEDIHGLMRDVVTNYLNITHKEYYKLWY